MKDMTFEMGIIQDTIKRIWKVVINGCKEDVIINGRREEVRHLELVSPHGTLTYGRGPEGHDAWWVREAGGGGVITLPYAHTPEGKLLIGLIAEDRPNMGKKRVWCAVRGGLQCGETHKEAQIRVTAQVGGLNVVGAEKLPGLVGNPHPDYFITNSESDEGVHAYGLKLSFDLLELDPEGGQSNDNTWKLKDGAILPGTPTSPDSKERKILRFYPWWTAIRMTEDILARSAIAQLLASMWNIKNI